MQANSLKVSSAARKTAVLLFSIAAWFVSCYAEALLLRLYSGHYTVPHLPYLGNVPWFTDTDFFSSGGHVGVAIAIAALAFLLVEIAKALTRNPGAFRVYLGVLGFQLIVVAATFKHAALEWAEHFASLTFSRGIRPVYWGEPGTDPSWPWPPMAALLILMGLTLFHWREPGTTNPTPRYASFQWVGSWSSLAWLGMAWLLGALAQRATALWIPASYRRPHLANVAAFPWDSAGEPQSTTVQLFGALFFAVLGVLLIEIVKALQIRHGRRAAYWPLLAFQVVLFCDVVASQAPDWAAYALSSVLGAAVPMEAFPSWPWISLLALFLLVLPDLRKRTGSPREGSAAAQGKPLRLR